LYASEDFKSLFPGFDEDQRKSAERIWERILSRCGTDPDLPRITRVVDYGCGEGSFLNHLAGYAQRAESPISFHGIDCSEKAIEIAKGKCLGGARFEVCDSSPKKALGELGSDGSATALLIMSHTWFHHLDQEALVKSILKLRPALVIVDVFASWDSVVARLREGEPCCLEHGRILIDPGADATTTFWLRSERVGEDAMVRGIWSPGGTCDDGWRFRTKQALLTTREIFGGLDEPGRAGPDEILREARKGGKLVDESPDGSLRNVAYVRRRELHHITGWGAMDCHILVASDSFARILNDAFFTAVRSLISESIIEKNPGSDRLKSILSLFDDHNSIDDPITGSREALVILPFDPCLAFARIVPLFEGIAESLPEHTLLIEHPSRAQKHFPSANGVYQTCLARSSSAQAFSTGWAPDYQLTEVDIALEKLELASLGLKNGIWKNEELPPSYFMLPIYFGSLPLFCLALKFPKPFDPESTAFDVYYSTVKSLHDWIMVQLTGDVFRLRVLRPWIEATLHAWAQEDSGAGIRSQSVPKTMDRIEKYLFGIPCDEGCNRTDEQWDLAGATRVGGVLGKPWKSWVLGLPSYPIKKMAGVKALNSRLWEMWQKEKSAAVLNPDLRISLWFEEGRFFEDDPEDHSGHEEWSDRKHLGRLHEMLKIVGFGRKMSDEMDDSWLPEAVAWLTNRGSDVKAYFGMTARHFLFKWAIQQIGLLIPDEDTSRIGTSGSSKQDRRAEVFEALKAVFCKTLANTGEAVRFSSWRLYWLLSAASSGPVSVKGKFSKPAEFPGKGREFWCDTDPSTHLAELVGCLAEQRALKSIEIDHGGTVGKRCEFHVVIHLEFAFCGKRGGSQCEFARRSLACFHASGLGWASGPDSLYGSDRLRFAFNVDVELRTIDGIPMA